MTLAKSLIGSHEINIDFDNDSSFPPVSTDLLPKRYPVSLTKMGEKWEFYMGYVVSFLDIQDWCDMHGYKLVELYRGTRPAYSHERTDLL
jgi:hypothetical protein